MIKFSKADIGEEEIEAAARVYRSGWMAPGPETEAFEKEFAEFVGAKYAIFTGSCTAALKIAYKWYRTIQGGESVYCPKNTFCATYSSAIESGLEVEYYQRNDTKIKPGRVNVHYGSVKDETLCIIEDSAHRLEPNDPLIGAIRCYSFYITKNMTVGGQGGMLVTNDEEIYKFARLCWQDGLTTSTKDRLSGKITDYEIVIAAGGYDADDVRAAVGRVQLKKLPAFNKRRNEIVDKYNKAFEQDWRGNHIYPYFVKELGEVQSLREFLLEKEIGSSYMYPNTGWLGVSLPIYPLLTDEEVDTVIAAVKEWRGKNGTRTTDT